MKRNGYNRVSKAKGIVNDEFVFKTVAFLKGNEGIHGK